MSSEQDTSSNNPHGESLSEILFERLVASKSALFAGIAGPPPSFPLGNAGDFIGHTPWTPLSAYAQQYGSMCLFWLGTSPQILVSDPELVWRVLEGDWYSFYKDSPCKALIPILSTANAFVNNGEAWRVARETDPLTVAVPPPHNGGPAKLPPLDLQTAHTLVNARIEDLLVKTAREQIDLRPWVIRLVFDLFSLQAAGKLLDDDVFEDYLDLTATADERMSSLYCLKALNPLASFGRRKFRNALKDVVIEARKNPGNWKDTFLGTNLARGTQLDDETLATQLGNMFFGGAQSVPAGILATLYCLAQNPAACARVQAEMKDLFARHPNPTVAELDACPELDYALLEALRLYPPAPVYMRNTDKENTVQLGGHELPPDTTVFVCTYAIQRSPAYWSDPNTFKPERWANGGKDRDPLGSGRYFPFGRGRRACLGQTIALIDMKLILATMLARGKPETEATYVEESYFVVLQPKTMFGRLIGTIMAPGVSSNQPAVPPKGCPTTLRKDDPKPRARDEQLNRARETYKYAYDILPPIAFSAQVPEEDEPTAAWTSMIVERSYTLYQNATALRKMKEELLAVGKLKARVGSTSKHAASNAFEEIKNMVMDGAGDQRARDLLPFLLMYQNLEPRAIAANHWLDVSFGRLRVAGPNPMELRRVTTPGPNFPVTNAQFRQAMVDPQDSLEAAGAEGRLFLTDYSALDGLPTSSYPYGPKYLVAPYGLFAVPKSGRGLRELVPVAIQLFPTPGESNPIFTSADGIGWAMAKYLLNVADGQLHQAFRHLAFTHLVLEAVVVATHRQLPSKHPLYCLLLPHFNGTLSINANAVTGLICNEGGVDAVMAVQIEKVRELVGKARNAWNFDEAMFEKDLAARGVADEETLPYYPFRDDARLLQRAIFDWVHAYLLLYYTSSEDVQADTELQAWAGELASPEGGRMKGFGQNGRIETLEYLAAALTHIIFTASVQHAAVNFPQFTSMTYAPAFALAAYHAAPQSKEGLDIKAYMDLLPPLGAAQYQLALGYLLGSLHYTKLGAYEKTGVVPGIVDRLLSADDHVHFLDERVARPLQAFRAKLHDIENTVNERNLSRPWYGTLLPSQIPESINI